MKVLNQIVQLYIETEKKLLGEEKEEESYLEKSLKQLLLGNFTDDVTLLGTALQIGAGIFNLDLLMDIRDLTADFCNWEWSWGHLAQTTLDLVGLLPVVGVLKYGDEAFTLAKHSDEVLTVAKHGDELALAGGDTLKYGDEVFTMAKQGDEFALAGGGALKCANDVSEEALKVEKNVTSNIRQSKNIVETTEDAIKGGSKTVDINNPVLDNIRTGSALKDDSLHAFNDIIDNYVGDATKFSLTGGDGVERNLYQIEGSLNGKQGIFEWTVDPDPTKGVTHRRFIEGVGITGKPNARP